MICVAHHESFTQEEKAVIGTFTKDLGMVRFEEHVPTAATPRGPVVGTPLSWLVWAFIGTSAALVLTSFLESIGSELGKRMDDHFWAKAAQEKETFWSQNPIVVVYEVKAGVIRLALILHSTST